MAIWKRRKGERRESRKINTWAGLRNCLCIYARGRPQALVRFRIAELFQPSNYVLAVGVFFQCRHMWFDASHQELSLAIGHNIQDFLHHIVGILIFHHYLESGCSRFASDSS